MTRRSRRAAIAAAVAGLLAGTVLLAVSPPRAAAAHYTCAAGEFCLYFNEDANGGYYHYEFSDSNLDNDKYDGADEGETVGDTARNVQNNGEPAAGPGGKDDVVVYGLPRYKGADGCISRGTWGPLPSNWWNNIESYRWATETECERAGIIPLGEEF